MEDKINEIKKQMEDATKQMNDRRDSILSDYESQINSLREQYNNRLSELESQGFSSSDIYMDEQLINLNNEITRLTSEADRVFEDLNKELDGKIADLNKQLEFEEDKARRIGEKNKELDSRMNELEQEGLSYGEMQMDPEVLRIQKEIEEITNEMSESERKLLEQKEKEEKEEQEKNDAIKEYGDLKEQKAELESQLEEVKRELEEQNASLEKEKAEREAVMRQLEERHNTDVPEYKECEADLKRIQEILDANSNKTKIDEITKNIDEINNKMSELEAKYGKDVLEPVQPEPVQPEPQPRRYGRRFNSEPKQENQGIRDDLSKNTYEKENLTSQDCFEIAKAAYDMMTSIDKKIIGNSMNLDEEFYNNMRLGFPEIFKGNSEIEQRMICDSLKNLYKHEFEKESKDQQQPQVRPQQQPQVKQQHQPQIKPQQQQQAPETRPMDLQDLLRNVNLSNCIVDLSTGTIEVNINYESDKNGPYKYVVNLKDAYPCKNINKFKQFFKKENIRYDDNMDPTVVMALSLAMENYVRQNKLNAVGIDIYSPLINKYADAIKGKSKPEDCFILYDKTDANLMAQGFRRKSLEKELMPYIRQAEASESVFVSGKIDTRTFLQKLTDRVRSIFNPQNRLPKGVAEAMQDHQVDLNSGKDEKAGNESPKQEDLAEKLHKENQKYQKGRQNKTIEGHFVDVSAKEGQQQAQQSPEQDDHDEMEQ